MTTEERAFLAAWKACSAWDGKITKPVLRKAIEAYLAARNVAEMEGEAERLTRLTRPIIGIENRAPLEVFDIMADRIRATLRKGDK
jgi:indole-3-glycerol phosphate synthase